MFKLQDSAHNIMQVVKYICHRISGNRNMFVFERSIIAWDDAWVLNILRDNPIHLFCRQTNYIFCLNIFLSAIKSLIFVVQIIVFKLPVLPIHPSNRFDFMSHEYITTTINKLVMNGVLMQLGFYQRNTIIVLYFWNLFHASKIKLYYLIIVQIYRQPMHYFRFLFCV